MESLIRYPRCNSEHKIIYVVGNSRSGTTMLARVLGLNDEVYSFQELHFFEQMISPNKIGEIISREQCVPILNKLIGIEVEGFYTQKDLSVYSGESEEIIDSLILRNVELSAIHIYEAYLLYWAKKMGKQIPCEQTPRNLFYINEIIQQFPNVKIINMIRDPRSILLSQKNRWKRRALGDKKMPLKEVFRVWMNYHPVTVAKMWVSAIKVVLSDYDLRENVLSIKYENLVENPEDVVAEICNFCEITFDKKMLLVSRIGSSIERDDPHQVGIDKNKISTWKSGGINQTELYIAQKIGKEEMSLLGYKEENIRPNYLYLVYLYLIWPIKIMFSILLNINRMKNIVETLKRRV